MTTYQRVRDGQLQTVTRRGKNHGQSKTPLYRMWKAMVRRCESPKAHNFKWYGAKGVIVCPEWRGDFMNFKQWAEANGYVHGLELDRKNSSGPYSPRNCRWRTKKANIRDRDLYWDDELDTRLIATSLKAGVDPYALIREAVEKYLPEVEGR